MDTKASAYGYESDKQLHTLKWRRFKHMYSYAHAQTQTHTYLHTVVLIKALDVSREICNPDI